MARIVQMSADFNSLLQQAERNRRHCEDILNKRKLTSTQCLTKPIIRSLPIGKKKSLIPQCTAKGISTDMTNSRKRNSFSSVKKPANVAEADTTGGKPQKLAYCAKSVVAKQSLVNRKNAPLQFNPPHLSNPSHSYSQLLQMASANLNPTSTCSEKQTHLDTKVEGNNIQAFAKIEKKPALVKTSKMLNVKKSISKANNNQIQQRGRTDIVAEKNKVVNKETRLINRNVALPSKLKPTQSTLSQTRKQSNHSIKQHILKQTKNVSQINKHNVPMKRQMYEDSYDDDEDEDDLDGFIVNSDEEDNDCRSSNPKNISRTIQSLFKHNRHGRSYIPDDSDDDCMESSFADIMKEEKKSTRLGMLEDLEDIMREETERKKRKQLK